MSGRIYPNPRIYMTAEELQASRDNWNNDGERDREIKELKREIERMTLESEREKLEQQLAEAATSAAPPQPASSVAPPQSARQRRRSIAQGTEKAIEAVVAVLWIEGHPPAGERELARQAAKWAAKSESADPDSPLDPDGSTLRGVARSALKGIDAANKG
jgi:hypothetical protein